FVSYLHSSLYVLDSCSFLSFFFFLLIRPPPISTLFPYTTLFRSHGSAGEAISYSWISQAVRQRRSASWPRAGWRSADWHASASRSEEHTSETPVTWPSRMPSSA